MAKGVLKWFLYLVAAALVFLGIIFIMASYAAAIRLFEGLVFIGVAILIVYFNRERKPVEIRQRVELSGPARIKEIKCPNCGANLDPNTVQVIDGKPYMNCEYCGNKFEISEEPKW